jgi:hypothetical protein
MVYLHTINPNLGLFFKALEQKSVFYVHLEYCMAIWHTLPLFGIFYCHLVFLLPFGIYGGNSVYNLRFGKLH